MRLLTLALLGLMAAALPARAEENCAAASTQAAINRCAAQDYQREQTLLDRTLRQVLAGLEERRRDALVKGQETWTRKRDEGCKAEARSYEGGSLYAAVLSGCLTDRTRARREELQGMAAK